LPGRGPDADRRRGERDPGACGPAGHRNLPHHPAERLMGDSIVERLTELEGAVKRAAEALARMREENAELKREVKRLGDERRQVLTQVRSEEHTSELQSRFELVCRLLLEKK